MESTEAWKVTLLINVDEDDYNCPNTLRNILRKFSKKISEGIDMEKLNYENVVLNLLDCKRYIEDRVVALSVLGEDSVKEWKFKDIGEQVIYLIIRFDKSDEISEKDLEMVLEDAGALVLIMDSVTYRKPDETEQWIMAMGGFCISDKMNIPNLEITQMVDIEEYSRMEEFHRMFSQKWRLDNKQLIYKRKIDFNSVRPVIKHNRKKTRYRGRKSKSRRH